MEARQRAEMDLIEAAEGEVDGHRRREQMNGRTSKRRESSR